MLLILLRYSNMKSAAVWEFTYQTFAETFLPKIFSPDDKKMFLNKSKVDRIKYPK